MSLQATARLWMLAFLISQVGPGPIAKGQNSQVQGVSVDLASPSSLGRYFDPVQGVSAAEIVTRALAANGELQAVRLDIERARGRLQQAGLRPNPTLDYEQKTGNLTGSKGENETKIGISLPIELGQQGRRIDLAQIELEAAEAEVAERERQLIGEVLRAYADALIALRELEIVEGLTEIDLQTVKFVQIRVNEGESAPLELSLLQVEVDRLRSRRVLIEGRLQALLLNLKSLIGLAPAEPLRLRETLVTNRGFNQPSTIDAAAEIALRSRPDLKLAVLNQEVAAAGLRLVKAQARPGLSAFAHYSVVRSEFDFSPTGSLPQRDRLLTFGVSVGLPVFNRNQGAKAEAAVAIRQAQQRRDYLEQVIRYEIAGSYARFNATDQAILTIQHGVISRAMQNVNTLRAAYQLGQFTITELLAEQRRLLDVERDYTEALAERYRAMVQIQIVLGASNLR